MMARIFAAIKGLFKGMGYLALAPIFVGFWCADRVWEAVEMKMGWGQYAPGPDPTLVAVNKLTQMLGETLNASAEADKEMSVIEKAVIEKANRDTASAFAKARVPEMTAYQAVISGKRQVQSAAFDQRRQMDAVLTACEDLAHDRLEADRFRL
jgi:hypothetical protein